MINSTEKDENVSFYRIEADSCPDACIKYGISGIPTILILKDGK
jgi:thioredoxin-like negative regulator of GroEL